MTAIADHLWQSTLFAGVVWLLTLALRKNRARVRHGLWLAASFKFLIPFSMLIALGSQVHWRIAPATAQSNITIVVDQIAKPFTAPATPAIAPLVPSRLPELLLGVWACGFVGIASAWWIRWRRIRAAVRAGSRVHLDIPIQAVSSPTLLEPGVFGVFRPVLLLPEGIFARLTPAQLQAVIAHELCHVRHRDNLVATIHMFVETMFWFHPLVWWIGKRMVEERERACDEEVLLLFGEPKAYAEGILNVCKLYVESPLKCVSGVSGANLKKRIEAIMQNRVSRELEFGKKFLLTVAGMVIVAGPVAIGLLDVPQLRGQSAPGVLAFDVASIKPSAPGRHEGQARTPPGGQSFTASNIPLKFLIIFAYGLKPDQLSGGPSWVNSDAYDIQAKTSHPASHDELMRMLQTLLADRFKLILRDEKKVQSVYALVTEKDGPKLKQNEVGGELMFYPVGLGHYTASNVPMSYLAWSLGRIPEVGRVVVDKTGLTGSYDFDLQFTPVLSVQNSQDGGVTDPGASLFTALRQQLGLKLESIKEPVDFFTIDHAERPSEN